MKKLFVFCLFSILNVNLSFAQSVYVQGTINCGLWLETRINKNSIHFEHYVLGFVNGLAVGRAVDIWRENGTQVSKEQLYYWMDNYCKNNPLKSVVTGAFDFANEVTNDEFRKKHPK